MCDEAPEIRVLYRYEDSMDHSHLTAYLKEFRVERETPKGYWFLPPWMADVMPEPFRKKHRRWVSKSARKRYCYPTKEEAWASYRRRKEVHLSRLRQQLELTEKRVRAMENLKMDLPPKEKEARIIGHGLYFHDY